MASEWPLLPLGSVTENFDRIRVPVKERDRVRGPYPYYGASGVVDHVDDYLFDGTYLLIAEDGENLRSRQTPIAFMANGRFWVNNHAHIVRGNEKADTRFLMYALAETDITGYLSGSTMPKLTQGNMNRIPVVSPPLPIQQRIADVLGKLDDKIELNRRMNRTLEKMAAAIFKSWFIDFDPVHAKAEGRDSNLPAGIADLFPDAFEDSALGPIPKGWCVGPLSELAELTTRSVKPGEQPDALWEHYSIPAYDEGQQPHRDLGDTIKSGKYAVPERSVLVSKLNPQFPRIWLPHVTDPALAICSTELMPFVAHKDHWRPFIYEMMKAHPVQDAIKTHASGSTGSRQRVKPKEVAAMAVITPPPDLIDAFSDKTALFHNRVLLNRRQNRRLAGLRDTLLPKLLSGEIELPEAEAIAEEVA